MSFARARSPARTAPPAATSRPEAARAPARAAPPTHRFETLAARPVQRAVAPIQMGGAGSRTMGAAKTAAKDLLVYGSFRPPVTHGYKHKSFFAVHGDEARLTIPAIEKQDPAAKMVDFLGKWETEAKQKGAKMMVVELVEVINPKLQQESYWTRLGYTMRDVMDIPHNFQDADSASSATVVAEKRL